MCYTDDYLGSTTHAPTVKYQQINNISCFFSSLASALFIVNQFKAKCQSQNIYQSLYCMNKSDLWIIAWQIGYKPKPIINFNTNLNLRKRKYCLIFSMISVNILF